MDDIRYTELRFLQSIAARGAASANASEAALFDLPPQMYSQMISTLAEDLHIRFEDPNLQKQIWLVRGEVHPSHQPAGGENPRLSIEKAVAGPAIVRLALTYRGLRRIEELRELLKRDRVLEDFGILLSIRYLQQDLLHAISRSAEIPISVIRADMDGFKRVNDVYGHDAGDEVMKAYLQSVRDAVGDIGTCYRGSGDEAVAIIVGQDSERALAIAEDLRSQVEAIRAAYKGNDLPTVTASIGVASSPPSPRSRELDALADQAQRSAKERGKNCVVVAE